jgi:mannose-1-phosphate guanylyltransferase
MTRRVGRNLWGLVLAGGDGTRLQELTRRISGLPMPKQYCRIVGDRSLFEMTLERIAPLTPRARTMAVVNETHLSVAGDQLRALAPENLLIQPGNRDTGPGLLFSLLTLAVRQPHADVAVFPSDHYVGNEEALRSHVGGAVRLLDRFPDKVVLLGIAPDRPDPEMGYIEPGARIDAGGRGEAFHVRAFREKPRIEAARALHRRGGLWNSFIMVFRLGRMLDLLRRRRPAEAAQMRALVAAPQTARDRYAAVPPWNFSTGFLARVARHLVVVRTHDTGWSDWGTPQAVERTLAHTGQQPPWLDRRSGAA